jgi:hypothetical protein
MALETSGNVKAKTVASEPELNGIPSNVAALDAGNKRMTAHKTRSNGARILLAVDATFRDMLMLINTA